MFASFITIIFLRCVKNFSPGLKLHVVKSLWNRKIRSFWCVISGNKATIMNMRKCKIMILKYILKYKIPHLNPLTSWYSQLFQEESKHLWWWRPGNLRCHVRWRRYLVHSLSWKPLHWSNAWSEISHTSAHGRWGYWSWRSIHHRWWSWLLLSSHMSCIIRWWGSRRVDIWTGRWWWRWRWHGLRWWGLDTCWNSWRCSAVGIISRLMRFITFRQFVLEVQL